MFLICDPYVAPAVLPDSFVITGMGAAPITSPADVLPSGEVQLHFDLTSEPAGTYTVTVEASLAGVLSAASAPATFTIAPPVITPGVPQNVRVSPV
jgi:hypothetical protein